MGGFFWLFNMIYTQASIYAVLALKEPVEEGSKAMTTEEIAVICAALSTTWLLSTITLLAFSEKGYLHTFYGTWTARDFQAKRFQEGDDRTRMVIITTVHRRIWQHFQPAMKEWLEQEWESLHQNRPDWFTDSMVRHVPSDMVPNAQHDGVKLEMLKEIDEENEEETDGEDGEEKVILSFSSFSSRQKRKTKEKRGTANEGTPNKGRRRSSLNLLTNAMVDALNDKEVAMHMH